MGKNRILITHEAPLNLMDHVSYLTDYDYALVHHFENSDQYYKFFKTSLKQGREVILDNSIFELKTAFDSDKFKEWITKLQPTFYIVPDVLEDGYSTLENYINWARENKDLPGLAMGTVQGQSYQEIVDCYRALSFYCPYIALSFDMSYYEFTGIGSTKAQRRTSGRSRLIKQLITDGYWNWDKPHHLLGCSLAQEFSFYKNNNIYNIRSIDTSNPVIAGLYGKRYIKNYGLTEEIHLADFIDHSKADEFFNQNSFDRDQYADIEYNILEFDTIVN